jgi:hypothetical protein
MDRHKMEQYARPVVGGLVILVTLLLLFGSALRDPRPHDIPVGLVAPPPMVEQLTQGFAQNAPGAFAFTTYASEADARNAIDQRDVVAALIVGQSGPQLVVAGAAGDAITGGVTAAFTGVFAQQNQTLAVQVVHPFGAGDAHGIILFFLILATVITSVIVGALSVFLARGARWTSIATVVITYAICAGIVGALTASWIANDYGNAIVSLIALLAVVSAAIGLVVAACARLAGPAGAALGALVIVLIGLISSGGPLGSTFLPDAYRLVAPWLPIEPAYSAIRGALYFDGAGLATPLLVLGAWIVIGLGGLVAADFVTLPGRSRVASTQPA